MAKALARGSYKKLVNQCFKDAEIREWIIKKMGYILKKELKNMCSEKVNSVLKSNLVHTLKNFKWTDLLSELSTHAPVLSNILHSCTKTRCTKGNKLATMGVCASILLKHRNKSMCLVQKIISVILQAGHSGKQVCVMQCKFIYLSIII